MKTRSFLILLGSLLVLSLLLVACGGSDTQPSDANTNTNQENQVVLPVVESGSSSDNETPPEADEAYPAPADNAETDSYPAPEAQTQTNSAGEAYPAPEEDALKPTPRGNDLVATDPTTVNLAAGQLQLVEMFAFW